MPKCRSGWHQCLSSHLLGLQQIEANGNRDVVYLWLQNWVQLGQHLKKKKKKKTCCHTESKQLCFHSSLLLRKMNQLKPPILYRQPNIKQCVLLLDIRCPLFKYVRYSNNDLMLLKHVALDGDGKVCVLQNLLSNLLVHARLQKNVIIEQKTQLQWGSEQRTSAVFRSWGFCSLIKWFTFQMPCTIEVWNSDHHWVNGPVFRPPFEYRSAIQMPSTIVPASDQWTI